MCFYESPSSVNLCHLNWAGTEWMPLFLKTCGSQPLVTPVTGELMSFFGPSGHSTNMVYTHTEIKINIEKNQEFRNSWRKTNLIESYYHDIKDLLRINLAVRTDRLSGIE